MAAARGAKVVAAARNEEALKELVQELKGKGQSAVYVKADVGREDEVNRIAETAIQTFGRLDTWVNNAGSFIFGQAMEVSSEDAHRLFTTNFWGVVHGTKTAVQHFKERGMPGAVINVICRTWTDGKYKNGIGEGEGACVHHTHPPKQSGYALEQAWKKLFKEAAGS